MGCASSAATSEKDKESYLVQSDDEKADEELSEAETHDNGDSVLNVGSPHSAICNGSTNDVFVFRDQASPESCFEEMSSLSADAAHDHVHTDKIDIDVHEDFFNG